MLNVGCWVRGVSASTWKWSTYYRAIGSAASPLPRMRRSSCSPSHRLLLAVSPAVGRAQFCCSPSLRQPCYSPSSAVSLRVHLSSFVRVNASTVTHRRVFALPLFASPRTNVESSESRLSCCFPPLAIFLLSLLNRASKSRIPRRHLTFLISMDIPLPALISRQSPDLTRAGHYSPLVVLILVYCTVLYCTVKPITTGIRERVRERSGRGRSEKGQVVAAQRVPRSLGLSVSRPSTNDTTTSILIVPSPSPS